MYIITYAPVAQFNRFGMRSPDKKINCVFEPLPLYGSVLNLTKDHEPHLYGHSANPMSKENGIGQNIHICSYGSSI